MCHVLSALRADLQSGRLVRLDLPDWRGGTFTMHLHHAAGAPQGPAGAMADAAVHRRRRAC